MSACPACNELYEHRSDCSVLAHFTRRVQSDRVPFACGLCEWTRDSMGGVAPGQGRLVKQCDSCKRATEERDRPAGSSR